MTKVWVFSRTWTTTAEFFAFLLKIGRCLYTSTSETANTPRLLRDSLVKYKFVFDHTLSSTSPSSLLELEHKIRLNAKWAWTQNEPERKMSLNAKWAWTQNEHERKMMWKDRKVVVGGVRGTSLCPICHAQSSHDSRRVQTRKTTFTYKGSASLSSISSFHEPDIKGPCTMGVTHNRTRNKGAKKFTWRRTL